MQNCTKSLEKFRAWPLRRRVENVCYSSTYEHDADTVMDGKTGFVFGPYTTRALVAKMTEAIELYREKPRQFAALMTSAMRQDFSWRSQVKEYIELYNKLNSS